MATAATIDPVSLGQHYKEQLVQTVDTLRDTAVNFRQLTETTINDYKEKLAKQREEIQPKAMAMVDSYKASIQDVETPVSKDASPFLQKTYMWTAVCMFASSVANVIGGIALGGLVGAIFDTPYALVLTFVALPAFVFLFLRKYEMTEMKREQLVLFGAVDMGALIGALFSERYATIYGPPAFILPLSIGLLAHYAGTKDQVAGNRRVFLGALMGGAVAAYVVYGFIFNFTFSYILSTVILSGAALADLQLKLASFQRNDSSPQLEQWKTVVILSTVGSIAHFLTSTTDKEAAAEANKPE